MFFASLVREVSEFLKEKQHLPMLLLLEGDLGVGKTSFTKELLSTLGLDADEVQSPTFLKLIEHDLPEWGLCLHIDAYRMEDEDDCAKLALESYDSMALCVMEWPKVFEDYWRSNPEAFQILSFSQVWKIEFSMDEISGERTWSIKKGFTLGGE